MSLSGRVSISLALLATVSLAGATAGPGRRERDATAPARLIGVELVPPPNADTLVSVTPTFTIRAVDPRPEDRPIVLRLQVGRTPGFTVPLLTDTTVVGDTVDVAVRRPLPGGQRVFIRATARSATGEIVASEVIERTVPPWLTLIAPNDPNGATLDTPRPRFVWRSARIDPPTGPWAYDLEIRNVGSGQSIFYVHLLDTAFTVTAPLELNTSYRWAVTARHSGSGTVTEMSRSSFVIVNPATPPVTLLYQNFPNPFPTATSSATCVWFDLQSRAHVRLDVFDLRGRHVKNMIPGRFGNSDYAAGRYGRAAGGPVPGCNGDLQWDGKGEDGRVVPAGVYLLRLRAAGVESVKKIVFRGRP
jgi:hypothetical protein